MLVPGKKPVMDQPEQHHGDYNSDTAADGWRRGAEERAQFLGRITEIMLDLARVQPGQRIVSLEGRDIDRPGRVIRLRAALSKNSQGRTLALEGPLATLIERRWPVAWLALH
jgi:hypothetical protein